MKNERSFLEDLRARTQEWRAANGHNQEELARLVGCSRSAIGNFESGKTVLQPDSLDRLVYIVRGRRALLAAQLRHVAEVFDAPGVPNEVAGKELQSFIASVWPDAPIEVKPQ